MSRPGTPVAWPFRVWLGAVFLLPAFSREVLHVDFDPVNSVLNSDLPMMMGVVPRWISSDFT